MAKENRPLLRRQKGWPGFVRSYKNYIENGHYDEVKWGKEKDSGAKSIERDVMGKIKYTF